MLDFINDTQVSLCRPSHHEMEVNYNFTAQFNPDGTLNNWATTIFTSRYTMRAHHVVSFTTTKHYNKLVVDDVSTG